MRFQFDRRYRLLVADDDLAFRETVVDMLQRDFETVDVEDGDEALEVIEQTEIHLVLFDMHMPRLTGLEAIQVIKSWHEELPCILMTAEYSADLDLAARQARAYSVIRKPPTRNELISTISSAIQAAYAG
ncbi:MAG: response regulator [Planctomycetaceae bacterium]